MLRTPLRATRTETLFPYTARFRSRRALERGRRGREPMRRCRLDHPVALHERAPLHVVRVQRRLREGQDRREADVGALHDLAPLVAGLALEHAGEALLKGDPLRLVVMVRSEERRVGKGCVCTWRSRW